MTTFNVSTERTVRWAKRCVGARGKADQLLFGIIQGGLFEDLRRRCVEQMADLQFDGFAVGGLGVGEGEAQLHAIAGFTAALLPADKPRYLMGVGRPEDIVNAVRAGFDMFDCVIPTRNARNGTLYTSQGKLNIKRAEFADDPRPLDEACGLLLLHELFTRVFAPSLHGRRDSLRAAKQSAQPLLLSPAHG